MPAMPVCLTTDIIVETPERECVNRLYWIPDTPPTATTDMVALANAVFNHYSDQYSALLHNTSRFAAVHVRYNAPTADIDGWSTHAPVVGGEDVGDAMGDEIVYEIQRRTGMTGRQNRGRIFISGVPEEANIDGILDSTFRARLIALAAIIGPDQSFAPIGLCHARHWDRKDNVLRGVSQARAMGGFASRRDRRWPFQLRPV